MFAHECSDSHIEVVDVQVLLCSRGPFALSACELHLHYKRGNRLGGGERLRRVAILSALLCLTLHLAACTRLPERRAIPVESSTIRLLAVGTDPHLDALISGFYGKYPDQRIVKVSLPGGAAALDEVRYRIEQGQVDVVSLPEGPGDLVEEEWLLALDPYLQKSRMETTPLAPLVEQFRWGGLIFDLPYVIDPYVLLLNKPRFAEAGLHLPQEGWGWDEFRADAERMSQRQGETGVWGLAVPDREKLFLTWLQQRSGEPFYRAGEKEVWEMLQLAGTMALTDRSTALAEEMVGPTGVNLLLEGHYGFVYGSLSTYFSVARPPNDRWEAMPLPVLPGAAPTGIVTYRSMGIASTTNHPDAAWEFLRFVAGPEGAAVLARAGGFPAYQSDEAQEAYFNRQPAPPVSLRALFRARLSVMPRGGSTLDYRRAVAVKEALGQVLSGQRSWEVAAEEYGEKVRGYESP